MRIYIKYRNERCLQLKYTTNTKIPPVGKTWNKNPPHVPLIFQSSELCIFITQKYTICLFSSCKCQFNQRNKTQIFAHQWQQFPLCTLPLNQTQSGQFMIKWFMSLLPADTTTPTLHHLWKQHTTYQQECLTATEGKKKVSHVKVYINSTEGSVPQTLLSALVTANVHIHF